MNTTTTIRLPIVLEEKLDETARKRGIKKSILIREILMEWFRERKFKKEVVDAYYDWREILHSSEFKAGFRDAFLDLMPDIEKGQTRIVVGVFQSPEYQNAVKEMIREVLTSEEYNTTQVESVSRILQSSEFIEHVVNVAKRLS